MRVLQINCGYQTPAGEDSVVAAERLLIASRHDLVSLSTTNPTGLGTAAKVKLRNISDRPLASRLDAVIDGRKIDVAHVHNTWFAMGNGIFPLLAERNIPTVTTVHNYRMACISSDLYRGGRICTSCVGGSPLPGVIHRCYHQSFAFSAVAAWEIASTRRRRLFDTVDTFIAPSEFVGQRLADLGIEPHRVTVKPHFVDDPGPRHQPAAQSRELLYVGRLTDAKGVDTLVRAWERAQIDNMSLTIVGMGPSETALREIAPRSVQFLSWMDRAAVVDKMLSARALVFPSAWYEPFGMVLIEALACGLPVLGSNISAVPTLLDGAGLPFPEPGNVADWAGALRSLADDDLVAEASANARVQYEARFTTEGNVHALEAIYSGAVERHQHPSTRVGG